MKAIKVRHVDFYPDEYIAGTVGQLTLAEQGAYWMLCSVIYSRGGPIDDDEHWLAGLFRGCHWRTIRTVLASLEMKGKIVRRGGKIEIERCSRTLQDACRRVSSAVENGSKGGRPRKVSNDIAKATGSFDEKLTTNLIERETLLSESQANAHSVPSERADERPIEVAIDPPPKPPEDPPKALPKDAKAALWSEMKDRIGGKKAGAVVGRWCATFGDGEVFAAHFDAVAKNPADYVSFMAALLKRRAEARAGTASRNGNRSLADQAASIMERLNGHGYEHEQSPEFSGDSCGPGEAPALDPPAPALVGR